jgi:uncharacterized membrane protein YobD (UPF0266 family)
MKKNMGGIDRIIRIIFALVIAVLFFSNVISGTAGIILLVLAGIFLITSLVSFCPLYWPFGINTCKKKE